jgi:hypothetical protein
MLMHYIFHNAILTSLTVLMAAVSVYADDIPLPANATKELIQSVSGDLKSGDVAKVDLAERQIRRWIETSRFPREFWAVWLPQLMTSKKYDDVLDLSAAAIASRPEVMNYILPVRIQALLALKENDDALQAAKSLYNVCSMKQTANAVDVVALCFARSHPDDSEIARRFINEQADASSTPTADDGATTQPSRELSVGTTMLSTIKIDTKLYDGPIDTLAPRTKFLDRVRYGDLLLASDRGQDAEKVFRELFQLAKSQKELTTATEGIACSLRAEDGTVVRANAWLQSLQQTDQASAGK